MYSDKGMIVCGIDHVQFLTSLVQVGPIPYGEVFGENFGYATIEEFISYMDQYALGPLFDSDSTSFKAVSYTHLTLPTIYSV